MSSDNDINEKSLYGDLYDIYGSATDIGSKNTDMTADYTKTRYDVDITQYKLPRFVREQLKILRITKDFLIPTKQMLEKLNNGRRFSLIEPETENEHNEIISGTDKMINEIKNEFLVIQSLLGGEIDELVIMSRTPKGQVIDAMLKLGLDSNSRDEINNKAAGLGDKLNEKKK